MKILSGIQPTGSLHIGNYLGAIKQWLNLQNDNECIFFIADLHALTIPYDPKSLREKVQEVATAYLAAGINPRKSIFFVQSHVKEHAELAWLLNTICPIGDLQRMTQYKEKSEQIKKDINAGLLNYPILMAADILLYKTHGVPVGEDQVQHIELARTIARKFNHKFGETFIEPKPMLAKEGAKIMSLNNPLKKMSKSLGPQSYISLFEDPKEIKRKIISSVTDDGKEIKYDPIKKPGISNLLTIFSLFTERPIKELEKEFNGKGYSVLKESLTELLIDSLQPFRQKKKDLKKEYIKETLAIGAQKAQAIAQATMKEAKIKMGL